MPAIAPTTLGCTDNVSVEQYITERDNIKGAFAVMIDLVLPFGTSVALPLAVSTVVMEKEHRLRALMVMMGLRMRWYWLCEWLWNSLFVLVLNMLFVIAGYAGGIISAALDGLNVAAALARRC